ncbi:50S ribosomal protein L15 [Candidatus Neomarinimicrobiota bacterium]
MKLGDLKSPKGATKNTKRLGRGAGSGTGKTSGRGHKGAGQRSGHQHRPWFEGGQMPLVRRVPKRGFSNYGFRNEFQIVNLHALERIKSAIVDAEVLKNNGLVRSAFKPIKILGTGEISKAYKITANAFSQSAKDKIEKAGGTVIVQ